MKPTMKYNLETETLTISGVTLLPEIVWDVSTGKVTKGKGPNAHLVRVKKSTAKKKSRKKTPSRAKTK